MLCTLSPVFSLLFLIKLLISSFSLLLTLLFPEEEKGGGFFVLCFAMLCCAMLCVPDVTFSGLIVTLIPLQVKMRRRRKWLKIRTIRVSEKVYAARCIYRATPISIYSHRDKHIWLPRWAYMATALYIYSYRGEYI